jgi:hypothetical protein
MAETSQRNFRKMLKSLATTAAPQRDDPRGNFQKLLKKPSGLGNAPNVKSTHQSMSEKLLDIRTQDIMNLTDAQADALLKALAAEEKDEGISWK